MTIENETCALCGVTIYAGSSSWSNDDKTYCSAICMAYDTWATKEEYIKHIKEDG